MKPFDGQVAIVTGASRGIGLAIAQDLITKGARVCITGRKDPELQRAVALLGGEHAIGIAGHADDADHQHHVTTTVMDTFGRIDKLVNNTGINPVFGPLLELDLAAARRSVQVNCLAALAWTRHVHTHWMATHGGAVVNVASIAGLRASAGVGFYGATKAMLIHLTKQLGYELGPLTRVNAVAPGVVKTKFAAALYEDQEDDLAARYPLRRLGIPDDVSAAVAFLLSEDAGWITGQTLVIDGGFTLAGAER
jgi:NAD(P)-dependent dehydrogenase (short-subunit alcohol dehydrogenase family)